MSAIDRRSLRPAMGQTADLASSDAPPLAAVALAAVAVAAVAVAAVAVGR